MTAPHHWSDDVLLPMVDALHPDVLVMSANRNNQFRHPSLRVVLSLRSSSSSLPPPSTRTVPGAPGIGLGGWVADIPIRRSFADLRRVHRHPRGAR